MKVTLFLDVWPGGMCTAWVIQPPGTSAFAGVIPSKGEGVRRYRVLAEVDDVHQVDAQAKASTQEEP